MATPENMQQGPAVRAHAHDTLDGLVWRHLGATGGNVEATLAANPGLGRIADDLPEGHLVRLVTAPAPTRQRVYLWD